MSRSTRRKGVFFCVLFIGTLYYFGFFHHLFEKDFYNEFHYPYDGDIESAVQKLREDLPPNIEPINYFYTYNFKHSATEKCHKIRDLRLVYLVKSALGHFKQRRAIRQSWGYEHRFSDVEIRTVFLLGHTHSQVLQATIDEENEKYGDIVQSNFSDNYFNNTFKTMSGFYWAVTHCPDSRFYMFVDDDYYVSTKNVLRFLRNPTHYPDFLQRTGAFPAKRLKQFEFDLDDTIRFYAGCVFVSAPHRHMSSKWYVSLEEYPYHMWPPYVTAGAYILTREALLDMYYASFYTKHFRFDDIYVSLLAYKSKIEPFHSNYFHFYRQRYSREEYKYVVASHGYDNPSELLTVWTEQKSLGNA